MRGRDYDWHREVLTAKAEGNAMSVITNFPLTRRERRRAEDRHERGAMLGIILLAISLTYLFFFY